MLVIVWFIAFQLLLNDVLLVKYRFAYLRMGFGYLDTII